jgi:hypothetical protein
MLRACCEAYRFGLDDSAARQLADWFNAERCTPSWNAREIEHKLSEAKKLVDAAGEFGVRREPEPHTLPPADAAPQTAAAVPVPDWEPMPLDCLPDVVREYVQATAGALGCPPEYVVMPLLAVLASAIGNSRRIALKASWSEPAVVWSCVIARSGTQKSPAHEKAVELLGSRHNELLAEYDREKQRYDEDMQAYEDGRRSRNKPPGGERMPKPAAPDAANTPVASLGAPPQPHGICSRRVPDEGACRNDEAGERPHKARRGYTQVDNQCSVSGRDQRSGWPA